MAAVAVPTWHHPNHDSFHAPTRPPFQYANPHPQSHTHPHAQPQPPISVSTAQAPPIPIPTQIPARNEKELTRDFLITILNHFSTLIPSHFNDLPIRLVVHGGACMLLHPGLSSLSKEQQQQHHHPTNNSPRNAPHNKLLLRRRISTRDVDYVHRSFVEEWRARGVRDAGERIRRCIGITARRFGLGEDWMNSDADVALPMAFDANGKQYDPIYHGAIQPNNVHLHTVFTSTNGMLTLISVPPVWSIALKLVRYTKYDPGDICLLLRNGTNLNNVQWTPQTLESWLHTDAAPMSYELWSEAKRQELKARIQDAIRTVNSWDAETAKGPVIPDSVGVGDDGDDGGGVDGGVVGEEWAHRGRVELLGPRLSQDPRWVGGNSSHRSTPALAQDVGIESRWLVQHSQHQQQQQQQQLRRHTPSQSQSHSNASHRPSPAPAPTPALSHSRSRSHLHLHTSSWHHPDPRLTSEVRQLDRDIATMLQHSLTVPLGSLPSIENGAHQNPNAKTGAATTRRSRDKRRAQSRAGSRSSKWGAAVMRYFEDEDEGTDEDEDGDGGGGRDREGERRRWGRDEQQQQQQQQQQHGQPFFPRPSAWLIYAPPPRGGTPQQQQQQQQQQRVSSPYHVGMSRPQTLTPYNFTEHRPSSTSTLNTIYPPDHRRSTESVFYDNGGFTEDRHHLHQSSSSTLTPYIPDQRRATPGPDRSSDQQQHVHIHRSATSTPYQHHTHQERPTTPFVPPDEYISTTSVVYPDSRSRSRSRSSTPYHHMTERPRSRSRGGSPPHVGPKDRRHRPTPLDLSPIGQLLVF